MPPWVPRAPRISERSPSFEGLTSGYRPCCSEYCQRRVQKWLNRWKKLSTEEREAEVVLALLAKKVTI